MKLAKLQENFANHIYDKTNQEIFPAINSSQIPSEQRLNVYRNNVFSNFNEALNLTYKITKKIVGEDYFRFLCQEYNKNYYSPSGNLEDFGAHFPQLIENLEEKHQLYYLKDIAKLEWLYNCAYFSKNVKDLNLKKLQSLSEDDFAKLYFSLHPSCKILQSEYPIYSIWQTSYNDTDQEIHLEEKEGQFILIERSSFKVNVKQLSEIEFDFLAMILDKKNIYQIYEKLSEKHGEFDVGSLVNKFISSKIIANFKIKNGK